MTPYRSNDYRLTLDDIRPYLVNPKPQGSEIRCQCPVCEADNPKGKHLYISNNNNNLVMYCQKDNCRFEDIVKAFKDRGAQHVAPVDFYRDTRTVVEKYDHEYRNPDGSLAYCKRRIKYNDGSKEFRFHFLDNGREVWRKPENCNMLYNLDLMQRVDPQEVLYIVEGEKCADAMVSAGLLATTSNTGAKSEIKFSETDLRLLAKFPNKVVIPDNDEKGKEYVKAWGNDVSVLDITEFWPDAPRKADIADYLEQGRPLDPIVNFKSFQLTQDKINSMSITELISVDFMKAIYKVKEPLERQQILSYVDIRAGELGAKRNFKLCWNAFTREISSRGAAKSNVQQFDSKAPINQLNCGEWLADMNGVKRFVRTAEDEPQEEFASFIPITPSAILKNIENGTEKVELSFYSDDLWHSINIQRSVIANSAKIVDLADLGIDVNSGSAKFLVKYLADVVNMNDNKALPRLLTVSHLGWVEDKFIPYDEKIVTDVGVEFQDTVNSVSESGTLEDWVEFVKPLRDNIYLHVTLATSFASPLISKVNGLPFVLMLWGGTGVAKTVSLMVAASVWGNPATGKMVKSLNNTKNYTMGVLGLLKHLPFFGDELQTIRERYGGYDELLYSVTEGVDRGRMTNSIVQKTNSWQNCCLFTGEEPISKSFSGGGAKNRVIEIECQEKLVEDGHAVSNFVKSYYGCAGRKYIESLSEYDLLEEYRKIYREIDKASSSTEKQAMAMAMILLGDKISSEQIFHDEPLKVTDVVGMLKSSSEVDVATQSFEMITDLISEHKANFDGSNINTCWGKLVHDGPVTRVYFIKTVLCRELQKLGFDFNAVKKKWAEAGHLVKYGGGYCSKESVGLNSSCYCVKLIVKN